MEQREKGKTNFSQEQYSEDVSTGLKETEETLVKAGKTIEKLNTGLNLNTAAGFFKKAESKPALERTGQLINDAIEKVRDMRAELNPAHSFEQQKDVQATAESSVSYGPGQSKGLATE